MMGRERIGGRKVLIQFADGVVERIEAASEYGRRAEFIRLAVEAALSGGVGSLPLRSDIVAKAVVVPGAVKSDRRQRDDSAVLSIISLRPMTERQLCSELGWTALAVSRACGRLMSSGRLHCPRGLGVMEAI